MKEKLKKIINKIKSNEFWKNLFKNSFFAVIGEGGASFINLFVIILLIKLLGSEGYGVLTLAQTYTTMVDTIINVQCWRAVIKYGEAAKTQKKIKELYGYIKLGTIIDILTAILGTILSFLLVNIVGKIMDWDSTMKLAAKIFSLVVISHFSGTPTAVLRMENKFNLVSIQKIVASMIKFVVLIYILFFYKELTIMNGVIIYAITDVIANLLLVVMSIIVIHKNYGIKKVLHAKLPHDSKEFVKFTMWTTLADITDIPVNYFDVFILSKLNLKLVAVFKVFKQCVFLISKLSTPIYQAIFPQFSKLTANDKLDVAYAAVMKIQKFIIMYILPIFTIVGLTSYFWLNIIFDNYYASHWYVLCIYLIIHTISISFTTIHPLFISMGKVKEDFAYVLFTNILYFICALILVSKIGIIGIVISYGIQSFTNIALKRRKIEQTINGKG